MGEIESMIRLHSLDEETAPITYGIVIPKKRGRSRSKLSRTLSKTNVGGSFPIQAKRATAHKIAKELGMDVQTRDEGNGWMRVWRTA